MKKILSCLFIFSILNVNAHETWSGKIFSEMAHLPSPLPDRVVLTWNDDPASTQTVNWRTDTSVKKGFAQIAIANANGRTLRPKKFNAETTYFKSDINEAHYHSVTFKDLEEDTLYAYRVGDGVNWTEYYHFRTASSKEKPFSFIYFGDAQNEVKTHWSRVFREAFRDAPRAAFTLHAGDAIWVDSVSKQQEVCADDVDKKSGGLYIIADLCHYLSQKQTFTKLNLIRDSTGRDASKRKRAISSGTSKPAKSKTAPDVISSFAKRRNFRKGGKYSKVVK